MNNDNIFFDISKLKSCGDNVIIGKTVRIRNPEKVSIGDNVIIDDFTYISGEVSIGNFVHIAASCTISASKSKIVFQDLSALSSGSRVFAGTSNYLTCGLDYPTIPEKYNYGAIFGEIIFEKYAMVGANNIILPNTRLLEGMATAANLVVRDRSTYKPWTLIKDNDGNIVKRRGKELYLQKVSLLYKDYYGN
ncbi:acyltransferase [Aliarcobacter cryaerophilus]|uniref:acyltransferase n=1 Tax=Aliarcobacter cryaerophilus TaxID=28198 RepID=UPI003DA26F8D